MPVPNASRLAAALALPAVLGAQRAVPPSDTEPPAPRVGDVVRLRTRWLDARGRGIGCEARVAAIVSDTVVVRNASRWAGCPRQEYPADVMALQVARGSHGSRLAH